MQNDPIDIQAIAPAELLKLVKKAGGQRAFAREHGIPRTTLQDRLYKLRFSHRPAPVAKNVGMKKGVRRFILSSAQDSTALHEQFLTNLESYCDFLKNYGSCEIMIGGFTYGKSLFEDHAKTSVVWPDRIKPYIVSDRMRIADKIDFCGEMNTLPTATKPLSDFDTYTNDRWGVFPHAKVQLVSVARLPHLPPKQIMTTGAITKSNYIMKKAGIKASFHHIYGAVLVEVDKDGDFFCRHLIADDKGTFYDLDRKIENGKVTQGHRLSVLTPGDVHCAGIDPQLAHAIFGVFPTDEKMTGGIEPRVWRTDGTNSSMLDILKPENLFLHDILDFRARNHHNIFDPHDRYRLHVMGRESVEGEVSEAAMFMATLAQRYPETQFYVVDSNHDQALGKWLKTGDYKFDPVNALFFLELQTATYRALKNGDSSYRIFHHAVNELTEWDCSKIKFLREDKDDVNIGGVEHSNHGHRGPNGSRGGVANLSKASSKMTIGHVHSPAILNGLYAGGMSCLMDQGYNHGLTGWSPTLVAQYANGKRTLITLQSGKWHA